LKNVSNQTVLVTIVFHCRQQQKLCWHIYQNISFFFLPQMTILTDFYAM